MTFLLLLIFTSCESDVNTEIPDNGSERHQLYYLTLTTKFESPEVTRSSTNENGSSTSGELDGTYKESQIINADLYLFNENYSEELAHFTQFDGTVTGGDKTFTMTFEEGDLSKLAQICHLIVVGNLNKVGKTGFSINPDTETFSVTTLESDPIGDFGEGGYGKNLPLVNATDFVIDFSSYSNLSDSEKVKELAKFFDENNELDLSKGTAGVGGTGYNFIGKGKLGLERAVARVDWRDLDRVNAGSDNPNKDLLSYIYVIGKTSIKTKIHSLQIFNVNTISYLFRHTAEGTTAGANTAPELFGNERGDGDGYTWVAGSDWGTLTNNAFNKTRNFLNPKATVMTQDYSSLDLEGYIAISELTKKNAENIEVRPLQNGYYPWRYITENTLPSTSTDFSENATGIAFRFKIMNGDEALTKEEVKSGTFAYSGMAEGLTSVEGSHVRLTDNEGYWIEVPYTEVKDAETREVDSENSGYFITYYASIVHNDDKDTTNVGPMEYAIVRNNIYEISVKSLSRLPNPNDPEDFSIELYVQVLPWGLRVDDDIIIK